MIAVLAKYLGGKVLTAILVVAVGLAGYWFYQHPEQIAALWLIVRRSLVWLAFVAILPWGLFFLPAMVMRAESNAAAAGLLAGYLVLDIVFALWLAEWRLSGGLTWAVVVVGFLVAGVYNFLVCDYLAEKSEAHF